MKFILILLVLPMVTVDGGWTLWTPYSSCSVYCGIGTQTRTRSCTEPTAQHGGNPCTGPSEELRNCNTPPCPMHGDWSLWSSWGPCSATSGNHTKIRTRSCTNPPPVYGGKPCYGSSEDSKSCSSNVVLANVMAAGCSGTSSDWSCCTSLSPCQEEEGDCDNDSECAGSLVCGSNNCKDFHPLARVSADCCVKPVAGCSGTSSDWSCCTSLTPCQEEEGDCDNDSECAGSLVCGNNNCKDFHPPARVLADCCVKPGACTGSSSDWGCCTSSSPCQERQGDCDNDSQCAGSLVCGNNNCQDFHPRAQGEADCCIQA